MQSAVITPILRFSEVTLPAGSIDCASRQGHSPQPAV